MSYTTTKNRLQKVTVDGKHPAVALHEDHGDGIPLCGHTRHVGLGTFRGQQTKWQSMGPGVVTCGNCARRS